jgi:cyclase
LTAQGKHHKVAGIICPGFEPGHREEKMQKITANIYVKTGQRGSNNSVVDTGEGLVMIDTPFLPEDAIKLCDEIAGIGKIRYIINTEPHADHFNGNCFFEGTVIGHDGTRAAVLASTKKQIEATVKQLAPQNLSLLREFYYRPPSITFSDKMALHLGKHDLELINMPGHTLYQAAVYVPAEKVLFTGDNVVGDFPYLHQAVPELWFETLDRIEQMDVDILVPGHGEVCTRSYLPKMRAGLHAWIDTVKAAIAGGRTLEQAQHDITMSEYYPEMQDDARFIQAREMNITSLYQKYK